MIRINNLSLPLDYNDSFLQKMICRELRISENHIDSFYLLKRSVDARKKNDVHFIANIDVTVNINESKVTAKARNKNISIVQPYKYEIPLCKKLNYPPIIIGFGPAGMFAGLVLAQAGAKPIIFEQGYDVDTRMEDINNFINTGRLNTSSNIQFGEGGAGTFSDGKLNTGTKDIRARKVLIELNKHGAPDEILYNGKPHIGTDKLRTVVKNIRKEIVSLGGKVYFGTKLVEIKSKAKCVTGIVIEENNSKKIIETDNVILAIGHSSRDTFEMLYNSNISLEQKSFSVGARIEHLREDIDKSQYGKFAGNEKLGAAPYKLNVHLKNGRGVYTFCMCPGGEVVPATSEENMVCTNGMSEFKRNKVNSNSALLVGVSPEDFCSSHPLAGIEFQRKIEKNAFVFGGENYNAPVQKVGDFLKKRNSTQFGSVKPSYKPDVSFAQMDDILPEFVTDSMREAIVLMDNKLKGFANSDAILTGAETRSSSPVRILRDETLQSISLKGLYPCGEGAGYAGGIVSAAVDGIKCAEKILSDNKY
ncbi:MAG: NAD(P)/FAD-dependent oxidoreductase [Ruminococcus sp.]